MRGYGSAIRIKHNPHACLPCRNFEVAAKVGKFKIALKKPKTSCVFVLVNKVGWLTS
jgi:hypothetical protein